MESLNSGYVKISILGDRAVILGSKVFDAEIQIKLGFIRKVFGIIACQFITSSFITSVMLFTPIIRFYVNENPWLVTITFLMYAVSLLSLVVKRKQPPMNCFMLIVFTLVEACIAAVVVTFYDQLAILLALITLSVVFIILIAHTLQSQQEFNSWHFGFLSMIVIFLMVGFLQMHFGSTYLEAFGSAFGALAFSLFVVYDIQKIMHTISPEEHIVGAIDLYLDIFNIFSYIEILNQFRKKIVAKINLY